ncbi:MAG: bifunctional transcriptional activator/DNA repair enzyme AdaA [Alicyclobacillus macrosporangiidus]|uniref:bifunctional transcriptional activator/DNA repair enzyme AdaA n=1 Tax=Alicyclobacillus macrosporangiidus TaxID=392015 RepID=UPI0026EC7062|nr:bifunctional transcriptional activator/DNA repair enzyme AdaA [Alicyclobacillus macrosporangiidus]MCL6600239.1 bifunctional transcriptional activator/DNA repair enzyme AdaA [Alicyclobacillus macrosporangiidus]
MDEAQWKAIVNCDETFDGRFFYGVTTTGIFCRPSCRSRTPLLEHVRIFKSAVEARSAGFRPCKRCRPDTPLRPEEEMVQGVKAIVNRRFVEPLTLEALAQELSMSPYHLHRMFKRLTGVTPADYLVAKRIEAAKEALRTEPLRTITEIALAVGFRSASHFSTVFRKMTGCSPKDYRAQYITAGTAQEAAR